MTDFNDALKSLHTTLIDSKNGYDEALSVAEGQGLTPLFSDMIALRSTDIAAIGILLRNAGEVPDEAGSFMSGVHRTVISIRSMITELDESILPSLISGEKRILQTYDDAIAASPVGSDVHSALSSQHANLRTVIEFMQRMKLAAA